MKRRVENGDPVPNEGDWLRARRQSAGRGRRGREWQSADGNLFASTIVALCPQDPAPATLAFVAALAGLDAVERAGVTDAVSLKWPNDLLIDNAKCAGILMERVGDWVVVGFGVNIAAAPPVADRLVTSLRAHGCDVDAAGFLEVLADGFADRVTQWRHEGLAHILSAWSERAHARGTRLRVLNGAGEPLTGRYEGLTEQGALKLRTGDGALAEIHAGDIETA